MPSRRIVFVVPYPLDETPSQRFRFEQYFQPLENHGFQVDIKPFLRGKDWRKIYAAGHYLLKLRRLSGGFLRRFLLLFTLRSVDFVFIHREATPLGPPLIEWIIAKILRKKIIYDFDDAIWQTDKTNEGLLERIVRWRSKIGTIIGWSYRVSAGNEYLCDFARQFNSNVVLNPTTIDTTNDYNRSRLTIAKDSGRVVIGWTGSRSTLKYLRQLMPVLQQLVREFPTLDVLVIADQDDGQNTERFFFKRWSSETEAQDLLAIDIGIMPLPDDLWAKGKCGLKALQYMALRIPSVLSPVGVNSDIISHGINGYLCADDSAWLSVLRMLLNDAGLRKKIGEAGERTVLEHYSVAANTETFLSLFQQ